MRRWCWPEQSCMTFIKQPADLILELIFADGKEKKEQIDDTYSFIDIENYRNHSVVCHRAADPVFVRCIMCAGPLPGQRKLYGK